MKAINTQNVSLVILLHFAMYACLLLLHITIMSVLAAIYVSFIFMMEIP